MWATAIVRCRTAKRMRIVRRTRECGPRAGRSHSTRVQDGVAGARRVASAPRRRRWPSRRRSRRRLVDGSVHMLPEGYDTVVDDESGAISTGEKQLLTIARAFLSDPTILILDEATSSVDTRTEVLIQHAMAALRAQRTSFVIAHRLSTIRDADTILVVENGQIVEQGNHMQLLARGGAYANLYNAQFAGAVAEVA